MNIKNFAPLLMIFIVLSVLPGCKKSPVTQVVKFTSTNYETLGAFDTAGKPTYLLPDRDVISSSLRTFIKDILVDGSNLSIKHPELFDSSAIGDIKITQTSDVVITFVTQGAGLANSIAFYTYPTNQSPTNAKEIKTITYIFPNAGKLTPLEPGNKVKIGRFQAGTSIGFVLLQNAWDTVSKTLNTDVVHFCSNDALNPEVDPRLKKHAVLINYPSPAELRAAMAAVPS